MDRDGKILTVKHMRGDQVFFEEGGFADLLELKAVECRAGTVPEKPEA